MKYAIHATLCHTDRQGWSTTYQIPTFYLDSNVQGITSAEHAERIAASIINPTCQKGVITQIHAEPC